MFGNSRLKNYAEKLGGFESIVSVLIEELRNNGFFIEETKSTKIMLKQKAINGFNVIELILISESEIKSKALKRATWKLKENTFSLINESQRDIALSIINSM